MTCENSPPSAWQQMELPSMSSAEGSHARTSAPRERALASLASEAAYGVSTPALLASFDPDTSSWRTWQLCLVEGLARFSESWPRSGLMLSGIAYQLPPLAPLTDEIVSGLWATPTVNGNYNRKGASKSSGDGLATQVRMWPTPTRVYTRADWSPERIHARQEEVKAATLAKGKHHTGNGFGLNLAQAVRMWPTPNAGDYKAGMSNAPGRQQSSLPRTVGIVEGVSSGRRGGLNPTWVEWLMGFPMRWSELGGSETQSSRKSRS